jgi:hypothetical protein
VEICYDIIYVFLRLGLQWGFKILHHDVKENSLKKKLKQKLKQNLHYVKASRCTEFVFKVAHMTSAELKSY